MAGRYWPNYYSHTVPAGQPDAVPGDYWPTPEGVAVLDAGPDGDVPQRFDGGPQGFFGHHAEWGHSPAYDPDGGVACNCGESLPAPQLEAEAG